MNYIDTHLLRLLREGNPEAVRQFASIARADLPTTTPVLAALGELLDALADGIVRIDGVADNPIFLRWTVAQHVHDLIAQGMTKDEAIRRVAHAGWFFEDRVEDWTDKYAPGSIPEDVFPISEATNKRIRTLNRLLQEG